MELPLRRLRPRFAGFAQKSRVRFSSSRAEAPAIMAELPQTSAQERQMIVARYPSLLDWGFGRCLKSFNPLTHFQKFVQDTTGKPGLPGNQLL